MCQLINIYIIHDLLLFLNSNSFVIYYNILLTFYFISIACFYLLFFNVYVIVVGMD